MATPTIGMQYKFTLYNNPFIPVEQYGKLSSICIHSTAIKHLDVTQLHSNLLAHLPETVNPDAKQQQYYIVESGNSDVTVICASWLVKDPELITDITMTAVYQFKTPSEMQKYIELTDAYGFKRLNMSTNA